MYKLYFYLYQWLQNNDNFKCNTKMYVCLVNSKNDLLLNKTTNANTSLKKLLVLFSRSQT